MPKTAAAPAKTGGDKLSPSAAIVPVQHGDITAEFLSHVPSALDLTMTAEDIHRFLLPALRGTIICYAASKMLIAAAKAKMQNGEAVGGCLYFDGVGGYVDKYIRREDQTLEAAVRASYRLLDGLQISEKFDGSVARAAKKKAAEEKAKLLADKAADKAARIALEEAAQKQKSLQEKTNIEVLEAALEKQKTVTATEIAAEAGKLQRPLAQQLEVAEKKICDAAKIADRKSKADVAAENLVHYILQNVSSSGTLSVTAAKEIYLLASKFRICQKGEAA
jgi:hypothetical protein